MSSEYDALLITLTSDIVSAHVGNNDVAVADVPTLITQVFDALAAAGHGEMQEPMPDPAVPIRTSAKKDHLVCLDCGKKVKMLKRHLMTEHGLSPDDYRERWALPDSYPMVAPDYAATRRELAKKIGLGRKPGQKPGRRAKSSKA